MPLLCLVAGGRPAGALSLEEAVDAAVAGGVNLVQLREKEMPAGQLLGLARQLREVCGDRALLFVNDRLDVALASDADGIQLGERSLPVEAARRVAGGRLLVGRSVHSVDGARVAAAADLLVLGTIYASTSHPGEAPAGPDLIRHVTKVTSVPVVAIGGITAANAGETIAAGAAGVAVIGAILGSSDPRKAAADLMKSISRPQARR